MKKIDSKILDDIHVKFRIKFPNLANSEDLLSESYNQFKNRKRPKIIVDQKHLENPKDYECNEVQKDFALKTLKNLTPYDCTMMLMDGHRINDDAYLYFLPRLLQHVLEKGRHEDFLKSRLKCLDKRNLSLDDIEVIENIIILADEIERFWETSEAAEEEEERDWKTLVAVAAAAEEEEKDLKRRAMSRGLKLFGSVLCVPLAGSCIAAGMRVYLNYTNPNLRLLSYAAPAAGTAGLALLLIIRIAGIIGNKSNKLLLYFFKPSLYLTALTLIGLMIVHAAIAIAAIYYGALAFIQQNAVILFAMLCSGAVAGIIILSRNVFALIHDIETHVIGIKVSQEQAPELWQKVRYVANRLGTLSPDQIVLGLELIFFVTETDVWCFDGKLSGRTLYCSLPLCRLLNNDELTAIIGHELAHFKGLDTKFSLKFLPIYHGTRFAIISLEKAGGEELSKIVLFPAIAILGFFLECFSAAKNRISRIRELEADKQGALVSSKASMAASLVKFHAFSGAWHFIEKAAVESLQKGKAIVNLSKIFAEAMPKQVDENLLDKIFEAHLPHPTDSHPPLWVRLKSLQFKIKDMAENALKIDSSNAAINLLANAENLEETVSAAYQSNLSDILSINYGPEKTEDHIESKIE